jgi:hypothetical protein
VSDVRRKFAVAGHEALIETIEQHDEKLRDLDHRTTLELNVERRAARAERKLADDRLETILARFDAIEAGQEDIGRQMRELVAAFNRFAGNGGDHV